MLRKLMEKELKKAEKNSWKKQESVHFVVSIFRNDYYFKETFIDREHGVLENPTVEKIKSYATNKKDKVFKITVIQERIK